MARPDVPVFRIGDVVWHKTDSRSAGVVTGLVQRDSGLTYMVRFYEQGEIEHYACELTDDREKAHTPAPASVD